MVLEEVKEEVLEEEDFAVVEAREVLVPECHLLLVSALNAVWSFLKNSACLVFKQDAPGAALLWPANFFMKNRF